MISQWQCVGLGIVMGMLAPAARCQEPVQANPTSVTGGLVVSVEPSASRIGARMLQQGGNAVDAAVATALALAVTHPEAGNLGGGGFMVVRRGKTGECFTVDFREKAPARATPTMFLDGQGKIDKVKSQIGYLVVGVPGSPMGLWTAHQQAGRLPWRAVVAPAVQLAAEGFVVDAVLARGLAKQRQNFTKMGEPARVYFDAAGKPPVAGTRLKLPDLAHTLQLLQDKGPAGFYRGEVAARLAAAMQQYGGLIDQADLANYEAKIRPPVRGQYRGYEVVSMGPSSSGGVALIEMLNILENFDLANAGRNTPASLHLLTEAMKRAYYDRAKYLGDTDFVAVPVEQLLSKEHARQWARGIGPRATPAAAFGSDLLTAAESAHTTHFSVIDAEGTMVATTTTLEDSYGAKVIAPGTGFLLNNQMHDFNIDPGHTTASGQVGTAPNLIAPGKRMLSCQTPTLVLKAGKPFLVLGSPGGRTIPNTVLQVMLGVIDFQQPLQASIDAGRIHHQWEPDQVQLERSLPEDVAGGLRALGHTIARRPKQGDCHAIWIDPATGRFHPGVDHRLRGAAAGF